MGLQCFVIVSGDSMRASNPDNFSRLCHGKVALRESHLNRTLGPARPGVKAGRWSIEHAVANVRACSVKQR